jgi:uncharacterized small protein (DUF1192 family)
MTPTTLFSGMFRPLLQQERDLLQKIIGQAPLQTVESANEAAYADFLQSLLAQSGARYVINRLYEEHKNYDSSFSPRVQAVTTSVCDLRSAIRRARMTLERMPAVAVGVAKQKSQLEEADSTMRGVGKGVARHLNSILRRGKLVRLLLDSLHALFILAVFSIGFGWLGDSACTWAANILRRSSLPQQVCLALWGGVTIVLFALERWFVGPVVDAWVEARITRSTEVLLGFYFVERTRLEYRMAILEHEIARMEATLRSHNLL